MNQSSNFENNSIQWFVEFLLPMGSIPFLAVDELFSKFTHTQISQISNILRRKIW
jgi:hypothetical protein